jgi:FeS assembly SUF system regulator
MLRISKLTDYGTLLLAQLSRNGRISNAGQLASATHIALPTVSKLLKSLAQSGLVVSERGPQGGYALARDADQISAADIIDALEGPVAITECSSEDGACGLESFCRVGRAWQNINRSIRVALQHVSLEDLQHGTEPMPTPDIKSGLDAAARG